jgi:hypothetical protein
MKHAFPSWPGAFSEAAASLKVVEDRYASNYTKGQRLVKLACSVNSPSAVFVSVEGQWRNSSCASYFWVWP